MDSLGFGGTTDICGLRGIAGDLLHEAAALRAVVRGEQAPASMADSGCMGGNLKTLSRAVQVSDLAVGMVNLKTDPHGLAEWARFILVRCEPAVFIGALTDYGSRLIACLWELSFGTPLGDPSIRLAHLVTNRFGTA